MRLAYILLFSSVSFVVVGGGVGDECFFFVFFLGLLVGTKKGQSEDSTFNVNLRPFFL